MGLEPRILGFQMLGEGADNAVALIEQIRGGFRSISTFEALSNLTGSSTQDIVRVDKLTDQQIFFVSESQQFYKLNKTPVNLPGYYPTGDSATDELILANHSDYEVEIEKLIISSASLATTASYIDPTFISASAAAEGFGSGGSGDPTDLTALNNHTGSINTFTGSFTDQVGDQVRITIDAIPSESIFDFRANGYDQFGTKATGSITVDAGFGTGDRDSFFIDCQTNFVAQIQNFTDTTNFNNTVKANNQGIQYTIGGVWNAPSTEQFLLTASAIINDNNDLGTSNIDGITTFSDNAVIAGFLSSSVNGSTINFFAKKVGTFANNIKVAFTSSNTPTAEAYLVPSGQVKQLGGGTAYSSNAAIDDGTNIANIAVLDISGSGDTSPSLKRMDLLSFLDQTSVLAINNKLDTLISQSNSRFYQTNLSRFDINNDGEIGSADLLSFLGAYGSPANGAALPSPGTGTVPGERVAGGDTREGLRQAGGITDQNDSTLTNGTFTIGNQSTGSLKLEGSELIDRPSKLNFQDKIGGDPGDDNSGVIQSSGSLIFHSASEGSFEFNKPLDVQGSISSSGELIGVINGGSF